MNHELTKVLDHGHVRLVECMGSDLSVVRNARVSFDAEWRTGEDAGKDEKLVRYMYRNAHTSPFEAVVFTFDLKVPIFVARQWHRHRTWSYNEVSARYAELPEEFYVPQVEYVGRQSKSNKQARDVELETLAGLDDVGALFCKQLQEHSEHGFFLYKYHLTAGIPRELARCFLGVNTYTHFFGTVDLHNLFHFLRLRLHEHAQFEIREYAKAILESLRGIVPVSVAAFEETLIDGR